MLLHKLFCGRCSSVFHCTTLFKMQRSGQVYRLKQGQLSAPACHVGSGQTVGTRGSLCHLLLPSLHHPGPKLPQRPTGDGAIGHRGAGGTAQGKHICTERLISTKTLLPQEEINEGKRSKTFRACNQFKHFILVVVVSVQNTFPK